MSDKTRVYYHSVELDKNDRDLLNGTYKSFVTSDSDIKLSGSDFIADIQEYVVRTNVNIFDFNNINFENIDEKIVEWIKIFNMRNTMVKKFMKSAKMKAASGRSGMLLRVLDKEIFPEVVEISGNPVWYGKKIIEIWFSQIYTIFERDSNQFVGHRLFLSEEGKYTLETYHYENSSSDVQSNPEDLQSKEDKKLFSTFVYEDIDFCPFVLDINNEDEVPDIFYAQSAIKAESFFYSQTKKEWEWAKMQMLYNKIYGPTKEASQVQKEIEEGDIRVQETIDQQNLGDNSQSLTFLTAGSLTPDIAMASSKHFKTLRQELTLSVIPSDGGNNKHTTEILGANIHPLNYLWAKQNFTNIFLSEFYHKLLTLVKEYRKEGHKDIGDIPDYIDARVSLSRPTEILLNLNADSSEKNDETQKTIIDKQGEDNNA